MILAWNQELPEFSLMWTGPNTTNEIVTTLAQVESKIAVIMGPQGPAGPQGLPGDGSETYIWSPPSALVSWVIAHNLQKFPSITTIDSTGRVVNGEVTYLNNNLVEIAFAFPVSGTAYLN